MLALVCVEPVRKGGRVGIWAPAYWGLGEIDGLLVPPGKASKLLADHLITGKPLKSEPAQGKWSSQAIYKHIFLSVCLGVYIYRFAWVFIFIF